MRFAAAKNSGWGISTGIPSDVGVNRRSPPIPEERHWLKFKPLSFHGRAKF
jgi:hypothetical protein